MLSGISRRIVALTLVLGAMPSAPFAQGTAVTAAKSNRPAYEIVSVETDGQSGKLSVRLQERITEVELRELAEAIRLKSVADKPLQRISFYLPGTPLRQTPWAETSFLPTTRVSINGLRYEEVQAFAAEAQHDRRDVVGVWLTTPPALTGKLTIWREASGKRFAEWHLRTGSKTVDELDEVKSGRGRRFEIKGTNGGYYLVTWAGSLELGEGASVIATAEKLAISKPPLAKPGAVAADSKPVASSSASIAVPPSQSAAVPATRAKTAQPVQARSRRPKVVLDTPRVSHSDPQSLADAISGTLAR